jgi:tRNA (guanine37-N1)-methyltransferase
VLSLFPEIFSSVFSESIIKRAIQKQIISVEYIQLRQFSSDAYGSVDDHPYGGGHGMVLRVDVMDKAIQYAKSKGNGHSHTIILDASGTPYTQKKATSLTSHEHLILICGHYEGFDARIFSLVDERISIGDYILTGGEIPAMVLIDSVTRLLSGTLKKSVATEDESFSKDAHLLEYPQYTRPEIYGTSSVPSILLRES